MKFRNNSMYRGEFFVAVTIPQDEDKNVLPVAAKPNPDGSFRLIYDVLYAQGDLVFARMHASRIVTEHPTWKAGLYRANTGAFMADLAVQA